MNKNITGEGFEFVESSHKYYLDGKPLTGVTTILGVINKPALISWSARMAVEHIAKWVGKRTDFELEDLFQVFEEAKTAYAQKRDKAGDIGTTVHNAVEMWIKGEYIPEMDEQATKMFENFKDWATKNKVKFLESEKKMYSREFWFAGTADFVCEIDGKKLIGDLKTSSGIYLEAFYQCAGYRIMLEEMGETGFEGSVVVNIKKTGVFNEEKDVRFRYDYEGDKNAFLSALTLYRNKGTFKN